LALLARAGFRLKNEDLEDSLGNRVEFTLVTNSGNIAREKMATMISAGSF
jgi:hypothetical protein